jgi:branched-chain amino acid aminotransferase
VNDERAPDSIDGSAGVAFIDNEFVPIHQARLPILDWGFTRSDVTYDVVHVWDGAFFRLDDHISRFGRSCESLRLVPGVDRERLKHLLTECVRAASLRNAYVEMVCTRGQPKPGSRDPRACENQFFAFAIPFVWVVSPERQDAGARLHISDVPRISPQSVDPTAKNFHWGDLTRALMQALDMGADTTVLVDSEGNISEGPGFNVFTVRNGSVTSPASGVLEGITRASVRELCESENISFEFTTISPQDLLSADEVFLSSTAGGIMPVAYVNNRVLGNGRPGPLASHLKQRYWERHAEGWHATPIKYD